MRNVVAGGLLLVALFQGTPAWAGPGISDYFPLVPMEKDFEGLGGKIHVHERFLPASSVGGVVKVEVSRTIAYLDFPTRTILSTFTYDGATGVYAKRSSTSAFSSSVFLYHPPLTRLVLPFRKGATWTGQDGQNTIVDRVWGKVNIALPVGNTVCWVVRREITYDLIRRRSRQILYDYYARGIGFAGEGGWSGTGQWHWARKLLAVKTGAGSPPPAPPPR